MGRLIGIHIAPAGGEPMTSLQQATLEAGRGIVGDRYYLDTGTYSERGVKEKPDREVTLIEAEQIAWFNEQAGHAMAPGEARRNLVTEGVSLNDLEGKRFSVGETLLEGIRLCEPCAYLARLVAREVLPLLVHRGGLRARIVSGGAVRVNDSIEVEPVSGGG